MAAASRMPVDPEEARWDRKYPLYPGTKKCIDLLCASNVHGTWIDIIDLKLAAYAELSELIEIFHTLPVDEHRARRMLISQVGLRDDTIAVDFLANHASTPGVNDDERTNSIDALRNMSSHEARSAHWQLTRPNA